ncbi:MAG: response regulator, partial [Planctomycetota bacterium]
MNDINILIADDDAMIRDILSDIVAGMGMKFATASTAKEALYEASSESYDVVLLDLKFPDCTDLSTLEKLREICPQTDVLLVTAETDDLQVVADAIEIGAFDYVPKPIRKDDIKIRLTRAIQMKRLNESHDSAIRELAQGREIEDIIGESDFSKTIKEKADEFAKYDIPVLITGETGTG